MRFETSERVSEILTNFPHPVVLKTSEFREFIHMGLAILISVGAVLYAAQNVSVGGILIGLLGIGLAWLFAFSKQRLVLDPDGFAHHVTPWTKRYRWDEVRDFRTRSLRCGVMLSFDNVSEASRFVGKLNRATIGRTSCLVGNFGLHAEDLAALMNAWRARALPPDR